MPWGSQVRGIVSDNMDRVLQRGDHLELLTEHADDLITGGGSHSIVCSTRALSSSGFTRLRIHITCMESLYWLCRSERVHHLMRCVSAIVTIMSKKGSRSAKLERICITSSV